MRAAVLGDLCCWRKFLCSRCVFFLFELSLFESVLFFDFKKRAIFQRLIPSLGRMLNARRLFILNTVNILAATVAYTVKTHTFCDTEAAIMKEEDVDADAPPPEDLFSKTFYGLRFELFAHNVS
jgi:hypothetical protein